MNKSEMLKGERCPVSGESHKEERLNHWTHLIGLFLSVIGFPFLIFYSKSHGDIWDVVAYAIYGTSLILMYAVSTYYHGCNIDHRKSTMRIVDHSCIYLLIAGTYTPFALGPLRNATGWTLLGIEWGMAFIGILITIYAFKKFHKVSLAVYLFMGWLIIFSWPILMEKLAPETIYLVALGGMFYTLGTVFFAWKWLPFNHAVWHVFVLGGSISHYFAVMGLLDSAEHLK